MKFRRWIEILDEDVIQGEYGYEPGEFSVYPDQWRPLYKEGLTPKQAWQRALDALSEDRKRRDEEQKKNWERIVAEDRRTVAACGWTPGGGDV